MINVYSWPTPNGHKVHIMLEECGFRLGRDWLAHPVNIGAGDQLKPEFLKISPNNKIPALWTPSAQTANRWRCLSLAAQLAKPGNRLGRLSRTQGLV